MCCGRFRWYNKNNVSQRVKSAMIADIVIILLYLYGLYVMWITMWPAMGYATPVIAVVLVLLLGIAIQEKYFKKSE